MKKELLNKFEEQQKEIDKAARQFLNNALKAISRPLDYKGVFRKFVMIKKLDKPNE